MNVSRSRTAFARMFGSALVMQALLSATSLAVGLILIRRVPDEQYGYYVLSMNVVMLATALQNAFIQSHMVVRMSGASAAAHADLIGGLYREQTRLVPAIVAASALGISIGYLSHALSLHAVYVAVFAVFAVVAALYREFFRMVLLAYRLPERVLRADFGYAVILVAGAFLATFTALPAAAAAVAAGIAAIACGLLCRTTLWKFRPWNIDGAPGILLKIAPLGLWTAGGSAIHWLFSQGYNFLVAGTLGVTAVAAIAATRILIMPINLLSTGIGSMMLPTVSGWLQHHSLSTVFKRQFAIAGALALAALGYFGLLWLVRDWLFIHLLKKQLEDRDRLLLLWYGVGLLMLLRDQLLYLLLSRSRFRSLTVLTFISAMVALAASYFGMHSWGPPGALVGVLVGEFINVGGLIAMSVWEVRKTLGLPETAVV